MRSSIALIGIMLLLSYHVELNAQTPALPDAKIQCSDCLPLNVTLGVKDNVSVQAVMLPFKVTKDLFGGRVADTYATIVLTVSNASKDAAFIIHSVFIDNSHWALSGCQSTSNKSNYVNDATADACHVASAEFRLVRQVLLNGQNSSWRNRLLRYTVAAGSVAAGLAWSAPESKNYSKIVSTFTGNVIPAIAVAFPDPYIDRLNLLSDLAYHVNTLVPQQSSIIVIAYFPIDRFLTPSLKELFKKQPAVFFLPKMMMLDSEINAKIDSVLRGLLTPRQYNLLERSATGNAMLAVKDVSSDADRSALKKIIDHLNLNSVDIIVRGVMSVDIDSVPASIQSVNFDGDDAQRIFLEAGNKTFKITGSYLTNGVVHIREAETYALTEISSALEGSNDRELNIRLRLGKPIPSGKELNIFVSKKKKDGTILNSADYVLKVAYIVSAPNITKISLSKDNKEITAEGDRFYGYAGSDLRISLVSSSTASSRIITATPLDLSSKSFMLDVPSDLAPGKWAVQVENVHGVSISEGTFSITPKPRLTSATTSEKRVKVIGTGFIALNDPDLQLSFKAGPEDALQSVMVLSIDSDKQCSFNVPDGARTGLKVAVFIGTSKEPADITDLK